MSDQESGIVYLKTTDPQGRVAVTEHQCWSRREFIDACAGRTLEENVKLRKKDPDCSIGKVEVVDREAYKAANWPQH